MLEAYSSIGRTMILYMLQFTCIGQLETLRCKNAMVYLALLFIFKICSFHDSFSSIITPRYFSLATCCTTVSLIEYWYITGFLLLVIHKNSHLQGLDSICDHWCNTFKSSSNRTQYALEYITEHNKASSA